MYAVITGDELLLSFRALTFQAVHMWATIPEISSICDNDVAVLLALWHEGAMGQQCSDAELIDLGSELRVGCLTPLFRRSMLPQPPWFKGLAAQANIFASLWDNGYELDESEDSSDEDDAAEGPECLKFPDAWCDDERHDERPSGSANRTTFNVHVLEATLDRMIKDEAPINTSDSSTERPFYWNGYFWSAFLEVKRGKIVGFIKSVPYGPVPATVCVKYTYSINGSTKCSGFHCRRKSGREKIDLFPDVDYVRSLAELQPYISDGALNLRIRLNDVN